jgi:hypothetical protein
MWESESDISAVEVGCDAPAAVVTGTGGVGFGPEITTGVVVPERIG